MLKISYTPFKYYQKQSWLEQEWEISSKLNSRQCSLRGFLMLSGGIEMEHWCETG